jgi:hypothetical protein
MTESNPTDPPNEPAAPTDLSKGASSNDIVARAGRYYRNTRYLMAVLLVGMAGWFLYDGAVHWPAENDVVRTLDAQLKETTNDQKRSEIAAEMKKHVFHSDWDLRFQWILGLGLPPIGVGLLAWALHKSRGEIRLTSDDVLSAPGHPPVTFSEITTVDNDLWDRKGIVWLDYTTAAGESGQIVLDDFIYDRPPIDAIYDRIANDKGLLDEEDLEDDASMIDSTEENTRV